MVNQRMKDAKRAANSAICAAGDAADHTAELINQLEQHIAAVSELRAALDYYRETFCEGFCKDLPHAGTYTADMDDQCSGCKARAALETANNLEAAQ